MIVKIKNEYDGWNHRAIARDEHGQMIGIEVWHEDKLGKQDEAQAWAKLRADLKKHGHEEVAA